MLEVFRDEIPNLEKLEASIRDWLSGPSEDIEELREIIYEQIVEEKEGETEVEMEKIANEAMITAFNIIDYLIRYLEVNEINFRRLKNYIKRSHSYDAYDRLIEDFVNFISSDERQYLIQKGKKIFANELTKHWRDQMQLLLT